MVYFIECKSDTGRHETPQKVFQKSVESWGAIYEVVRDVKQVKTTVENITNHGKNGVKNIEFNP